jgi:lipid A 4'-phosphatase
MANSPRALTSESVNSQTVRTYTSNNPRASENSNASSLQIHWTDFTRSRLLVFLVVPLLALISLTTCVRYFDLDLRISRSFFDVEASEFPGLQAEPWLTLYRYGPIPGMTLGIGSLVLFVASFVHSRLRSFREPCALMALLLALGPGLLVNGILKPSWDRPRPSELVEFGGSEQFVPILNLQIIGQQISTSFPSGHASIGFYLLAPIFVLSQRNRRWSIAFLLLGLSLGFAMGLGRVAQGRHFLSDVLWSGAIVYFTGLVLAYLLRPAQLATRSQAREDGPVIKELAVLRIDDYREGLPQKVDTTQSPDRDTSKRRVA